MSTDRRGDALHLERALARYLIERRMSRRQVLGHMSTLGAAAAVGSVAAACTTGATASPELSSAPNHMF